MKEAPLVRLLVSLAFVALLFWPGRAVSEIVFSALEDGYWKVYWQADMGAKAELIIDDPTSDQSSPRFGADGRMVAMENSRSEVWVMGRRGEGNSWQTERTIPSAARPTWHSQMKSWVFVRYTLSASGEDSDIFLQLASSDAAVTLVRHTGNQDYPHLSRDGARLAYTSTQVVGVRQGSVNPFQQIWIVDIARGQTRPLLLEAKENVEAAWAPSGEELAFASNQTGVFEIWVVRADGTSLRQVTSGPGAKTRPVWSPDGERLLFTHFLEGRYGLATIDYTGKNLRSYQPFGAARSREVRDADWK